MNKAASGEIPLKVLKECDFSFHFLTNYVNEAIKTEKFPDSLKLSNIAPVHKKKDATDKQIIDRSVYYPYYQKSLKK